jgi:xanthine dehydrogenase small subunit
MEIVPEYFSAIPERLRKLKSPAQTGDNGITRTYSGGGTDSYVQKPLQMRKTAIQPTRDIEELQGISLNGNICSIGAGETMSRLMTSPILQKIIPDISTFLAPVGSTLIRNTATVGGNLVNASPIGDLTIMFLALDATVLVEEEGVERRVKLKNFYKGYKVLDLNKSGLLKRVEFKIPEGMQFHFERVCKRQYLDVASVNSGCMMVLDDAFEIHEIHLSAGGVLPIPKYLDQTSSFLRGKKLNSNTVIEAIEYLQKEIAPISDIRGSAEYKRLLLRQQFFIHMTRSSGGSISIKELLQR